MYAIRKLGCITIGQIPRVDVTPDIKRFLPDIELLEVGALDGLSKQELIEIQPTNRETSGVLVSRMKDGSFIRIKEEPTLHYLQKGLDYLNNQGVDGILMLCTGQFPKFNSKVPIWYPQDLLKRTVNGLLPRATLGIITPDKNQFGDVKKKWGDNGFDNVFVVAANPYSEFDLVIEKAQELAALYVDAIILDCIGYTESMKIAIKKKTGLATILSKTMVARIVSELS